MGNQFNLSRKLTLTAAIFSLAMLLGSTAKAEEACVSTADGSGIQVEALLAGQTIEAGTISFEVTESELLVTYATINGWELVEAHLWVGEDLASMPQTRKGNPKIGNFPYNSGDISGQSEYVFSVPLSVLGYECPAPNKDFYIAAHAALQKPDGSGGYQTETGWADGDRFVEKGSWATFSTFTLTCDCDGGGGGGDPVCETAFAFGGDSSTCFLNLDEDGDGRGDFNRWGWSNGPIGPGSYDFDIYAGAGQCDLNKGALAGSLSIDYDGQKAIVTYSTNTGFSMNELHLYVGSEILARDVNSLFTVAPGQYPVVIEGLSGATSQTIEIDITGEIYVVAHAVVCF